MSAADHRATSNRGSGRERAATTRLDAGEHSIDRVVPRERNGVWLLDWSIRLNDGRLVTKRSQGATKGQVRTRAKATAQELLATGTGIWKTNSSLTDYIEQVTMPAIQNAQLRPNSRARYTIALRQLVGECPEHSHTASLKGYSIGSGTRFRAMEACLQEIAVLHGTESARQARSVLSKYVVQQLNRDEVMRGNPLSGMSIDLNAGARDLVVERGGHALTRKEYLAVLSYLLELDPADGQAEPRRGRWSLEHRVAKRRNAIELTLLQATTGLRVSEANGIVWGEHVSADLDGTIHVTVTKDLSKTHRARRVPVLDPRVAARLRDREKSAPSQAAYVIGSPADAMTVWDRRNCGAETAKLYVEIAQHLSIDRLITARTHIWRATLNSLLLNEVPEVTRAAFFGHDTAVNRNSYTDLTDTSSMVRAARDLRDV